MHRIFVLATKRKEAASQRFSNLALISVTWQQSTLRVERWLLPVCPKQGKALISWALPELSLQSLSSHHLSVSAIHQCPNIVSLRFLKCWVLKTNNSILHAHRQKPKKKQLCVCAHMCAYIEKDFRGGNYVLTNSLLLPNLLFFLLKTSCEEKNPTTHLLQNAVSNDLTVIVQVL